MITSYQGRIPAQRATTSAAALRIGAAVTASLLLSVTAHSTKYPPVPSLETISGSWIAVREYGGVCKLVLDGPAGSGEISCVSGAREYRANVSRIELHRNKLTVFVRSGADRLEGEVVRSKFAARLGRERMNFFNEERIVADMKSVGVSTCESAGRD